MCGGCTSGRRDGFTDVGRYPNIAACSGSWSGTINQSDANRLCAPGWRVCNGGQVGGRISYSDSLSLGGCYAYNASTDSCSCRTPCRGGYNTNTHHMGGVGTGCGCLNCYRSYCGGCTSGGKVEVPPWWTYYGGSDACHQSTGGTRATGVVCCR